MSDLKTFVFLLIVGFAFSQENPEPCRTCLQSLMAGLNLQNMDELKALLTPIIGEVLDQRESRQCQAGHPGLPGLQGQPGRDGRDGLSGVQGPMGEKGSKGDVGLQGEVGQGSPGVQGIKGEIGTRGLPGLPGPQGEAGVFGRTGFSAYNGGYDGYLEGEITYTDIVIGEDLINNNTGKFTCKTGGTYLFVFSGNAQKGVPVWIGVYLNGDLQLIFQDTDSANNKTLSFNWTFTLNANDRVYLTIEGGKFRVQTGPFPFKLYFSGFLLK